MAVILDFARICAPTHILYTNIVGLVQRLLSTFCYLDEWTSIYLPIYCIRKEACLYTWYATDDVNVSVSRYRFLPRVCFTSAVIYNFTTKRSRVWQADRLTGRPESASIRRQHIHCSQASRTPQRPVLLLPSFFHGFVSLVCQFWLDAFWIVAEMANFLRCRRPRRCVGLLFPVFPPLIKLPPALLPLHCLHIGKQPAGKLSHC